MKGIDIFEKLDCLDDRYVAEGEIPAASASSAAASGVKRPPLAAFGRFINSGWGVAILCAVVSLGVLGGIIYAGQLDPAGDPSPSSPSSPMVAGSLPPVQDGLKAPVPGATNYVDDLPAPRETIPPHLGYGTDIYETEPLPDETTPVEAMPESYYAALLSYESHGDGTCTVTGLLSDAPAYGAFIIPSTSPAGDTVTAIGERAFMGTELSRITLPDTLLKIGAYAFSYAAKLTDIVLPDSLEVIGSRAFEYSGLNWIDVPMRANGQTIKLGDGVFFGCDSLWSASFGADVLPLETFGDCTALFKIVLEGTSEIESYAFFNCPALEYIHLGSSGLAKVHAYAFTLSNGNGSALKAIYYDGYRSSWQRVEIDSAGNELLDKVICFDDQSAPVETDEYPVETSPALPEPMSEPYIPYEFNPSAEAFMAKIAWADNVTNVRRGAAYIPVAVQVDSVVSETGEPMGALSMSYEYYVTELREVTYTDDTSRLYLILIDPRDGTVLAERYYELDTSTWGLFYMDNGEMLLYTASIREGVLTLSYYTLNWQIMTKMTVDEPVTEISLYESRRHTNSMTASIDNAISMYKLQISWQDFVTSLVEYNPTAVLVADGVFGPSAFFSYKDITGEGWVRLLLVMDGMVRDDLIGRIES